MASATNGLRPGQPYRHQRVHCSAPATPDNFTIFEGTTKASERCSATGTPDNFTIFESRAVRYSGKVQQRTRPTPTSYDQLSPVTCTHDQHRPPCNSFTPRRSLVRSQYRPPTRRSVLCASLSLLRRRDRSVRYRASSGGGIYRHCLSRGGLCGGCMVRGGSVLEQRLALHQPGDAE
jgi:hypothetical protein